MKTKDERKQESERDEEDAEEEEFDDPVPRFFAREPTDIESQKDQLSYYQGIVISQH